MEGSLPPKPPLRRVGGILQGTVGGRLRLPPTGHRKAPPPYVGGLWGERALQRLPPQLPLYRGEMNLPPRIGGVSTPPISLITLFFRDINLV